MNSNYFASLSINGISINLLITMLNNDKLYIVSQESINTSCFANGMIIDSLMFKKTLSLLIDNVKSKYKIDLDEIILIMPNNTLSILNRSSSFKIMSENLLISPYEIQMCKNAFLEKSFLNYLLISINPIDYVLDDDKMMRTEPLNYQSSNLKIDANLELINEDIAISLFEMFKNYNINILNTVSYATSYMYSLTKSFDFEDDTILITIDEDSTSVSFINKGNINKIELIKIGIKQLALDLANKFNLEQSAAISYLKSYLSFDLSSCQTFEISTNISQLDISKVVINSFNELTILIKNAINHLIEVNELKDPQILISGLLINYDNFINYFNESTNLNAKVINNKIDGIIDPSFLPLYGAIKYFINHNHYYVKNRIESDDEIESDIISNYQTKVNIKDTNDIDTTGSNFHDIDLN